MSKASNKASQGKEPFVGMAEEAADFVCPASQNDPLGKAGRFADLASDKAMHLIAVMDKAFAAL